MFFSEMLSSFEHEMHCSGKIKWAKSLKKLNRFKRAFSFIAMNWVDDTFAINIEVLKIAK